MFRAVAWIAAIGIFALSLSTAPADGFVLLRRAADEPASAARWSAAPHAETGGAGLHDGLQAAIENQFAEKLAQAVTGRVDPRDVLDIEAAVAAAFAAWENPVLRFTVRLDGDAVRGTDAGAEIDVFAVPEADPAFVDNNFFGVTFVDGVMVADRRLTNGAVAPGHAFTHADIFLNLDQLASVAAAFTREQQPAALQRLTMHEIGHALGLHHPNQFPADNYDTDDDPLNQMLIDPRDPSAGLRLSPAIDPDAVMSNFPMHFEALFLTMLRNDDRGGRDALYPALDDASGSDSDGCQVGKANRGWWLSLFPALLVLLRLKKS